MTKVGDKKAARKFCGALRRAADPKAYEGLMYQLAESFAACPGRSWVFISRSLVNQIQCQLYAHGCLKG